VENVNNIRLLQFADIFLSKVEMFFHCCDDDVAMATEQCALPSVPYLADAWASWAQFDSVG